MESVADLLGISTEELKYAVGLLLVFPLALIHRRIGDKETKHYFSLVCGVSIAWLLFEHQSLHFLISSTISLLLLKSLPIKYAPYVIFIFNLIYLAYGHLQRQWQNYYNSGLDWSLPQMLLCCKLTAFAWCYHDGQKDLSALSERQKTYRISQFPRMLEFFAWIYFFPGFLTGPFPEFNDYLRFTDLSMFKSSPNQQIPSSTRVTLLKIAGALAGYVGVLINSRWLPETYTVTAAFATHSLLYRLIYIITSVEVGFSKYYFAFWMGEAACTCIGISFNGVDEKGNNRWDRIKMMDLWKFKTAENAKECTHHWNIACQTWLQRYVYERFNKYVGRQWGVVLTFVTSAIWHGFYPGYYLFFVSCAIFSLVADMCRAALRHHFLNVDGSPKPIKWVYDWAGMISTVLLLDYLTLSFRLLSFEQAIKGWSSVFYFGHSIGFSVTLFLVVFGKKIARLSPKPEIEGKKGK